MSLPQIYRAVMRRYPHFKFVPGTTGWQSSIRHNLSGHPAFNKIEREGKGWMWGLDRSVSIEKHTKRRTSPPVHTPQDYVRGQPLPTSQYYAQPWSATPVNGQLQTGFQPYTGQPGMQAPQVSFQPNLNGLPLAFARPLSSTNSTYQSPYQSTSLPQAPVPAPSQPPSHFALSSHAVAGEASRQSLNLPTATQHPPHPGHHPQPSTTLNAYQPPSQSHGSAPQPLASSSSSCHSEPEPDVLNAIGAFKAAMIKSMPDLPDVEKVIESATNRVLGNQPASSEPISRPEKAIMEALSEMLKDIKRAKEQRAQGALSPGVKEPPAASPNPSFPSA
ncbi:MAG: hypothetical protein Q9187_006170 [Circinaria calcarea]